MKLITNSSVKEVGDTFQTTTDYALGHFQIGISLEFIRKFDQIDQLVQQNKQVIKIAAIQCD